MRKIFWKNEEIKFLNAISDVKIPNAKLSKVSYIIPKDPADLNSIPSGGGCYWIWTDEPVLHSLHKNNTPKPFNKGEIIYNGIAKDDVRGRIKNHIFGDPDAGWSAISLDIYFNKTTSHRKKALSGSGKVPYIILNSLYNPIRTKSDLLKIHLSKKEMTFIKNTKSKTIYFRNGIYIAEPKHKKHTFKIYFITGLTTLYLEFIEKKMARRIWFTKIMFLFIR